MNCATPRPAVDFTPFTVGDWRVEPRECRLSRADVVEQLRPQLMAVLVCLAKRPGQMVLRDEILREVWPGQFVAESGLSRCVAELRQALGDDAQQPRFIQTILKRGYRLIAPVEWLEDSSPGEAAARESGPLRPGSDSPGEADPTPAGTPEAAGTTPHRAWRGRLSIGLALVAVVAGIAVVVLLTRSAPARVLTEKDTILLADVNNSTGDGLFDDALRLGLAVNLEQAPFVRLLPQEAVRAALVRMGRAADERVVGALALDVCRREGAAVLIAGSIAPVGSRYAVGVEAIACDSGESLGRALVEVDLKEQVLKALDRGATQIRQRLGESRASLQRHGVPLARASTPSLEALRALSLGDNHRDHARMGDALALYRQATELDREFALAWARRATAARNLGLIEEADPALRRAFELRDRVSQPERFYIEGHYYFHIEGNPEKAIEVYRAWKEMYPGSIIPPANLSSLYCTVMGMYDEAVIEAREAVRLGRYSSVAYSNLVRAYRGAGRIAEARQALAEAVSRGVDDRFMHDHLLGLAIFDADREAIEREAAWTAGDPTAALQMLWDRASSSAAGGRLRESRRLWVEALAKAVEIGPPRRIAESRIYEAEAEALVGDSRAARAALEAALAADRSTITLVTSARVFALLGDPDTAASLLDDVARQTAPNKVALLVTLPVARALVECGLGRVGPAVDMLKPVARFERGTMYALVPIGVRGLVAQAAGRPMDAAAAFETLVSLRAIDPTSTWVAKARLEMARALSAAGNAARSRAAYDAFLDSWKDADPDAPLLAVARRERAALASL